MEIKDRVKALRKENHLTQEDMANLLGISPGGYSALETGRNAFDIDKLAIMAERFHVSIEYLAHGTKKDTSLVDEVSKLLSGLSREELLEIRRYIKYVRWSRKNDKEVI